MPVTTVEITLEEAHRYAHIRYRDLVQELNRRASQHLPLGNGRNNFVEIVRDIVEDLELELNKINEYSRALLELDETNLEETKW